MSSPASIRSHPIHPMLIVFPIGLWIFSLVCDVIYHAGSHNLFWKGVAFYTIVGGVVGALLAAIPGFIDYVSLTNRRVKRIATTHLILNLIVVALFPFNLGIRYNASPDSETFGVVLSIIATALLAVSGWLGGSLVYVHGVGVETPASKEQQKRGLRQVKDETEGPSDSRRRRGGGRHLWPDTTSRWKTHQEAAFWIRHKDKKSSHRQCACRPSLRMEAGEIATAAEGGKTAHWDQTVDTASEDSFPASDAPSWTGTTGP